MIPENFAAQPGFWPGVLSIILIDVLLAGDNAVVIAMAVRSLPPRQRHRGIILGSLAAVLLRIVLTFFIAQLLLTPFVMFFGGCLILWIAVKLLVQGSRVVKEREAAGVAEAVRIIIVADTSMALDNMLAVAGASRGNVFLLLFGLGVSIPLVIFTSDLLSKLMNRYPVIVVLGAAILGNVGGDMLVSDPFVVRFVGEEPWIEWTARIVFAVGVVTAGVILSRRKNSEASPHSHRP